jgi:hypothetical protein
MNFITEYNAYIKQHVLNKRLNNMSYQQLIWHWLVIKITKNVSTKKMNTMQYEPIKPKWFHCAEFTYLWQGDAW